MRSHGPTASAWTFRISESVARASRRWLGLADYGARMSVSLQLVQPFGLRQVASPAVADSAVDEVEWILNRYEPEMVWFADDVFTIHHGWITEYAAEMNRRGLRIPFECITRADRLNENMAGTLAALGCFRIWIGSESGSQRILDRMQRGVKVEQVRSAVHLLQAAWHSERNVPDVGLRG